jgi:hypothetical protein
LCNAMSSSRTQLARTTEDIFLFHRKSERERFLCNKPVRGSRHYGRVSNFVTARNNDPSPSSPCMARFSSALVEQVLSKYIAPQTQGVVILDPFCGSSIIFRACSKLGFGSVGIELVKQHLDSACIGDVTVNAVRRGKKRKARGPCPITSWVSSSPR